MKSILITIILICTLFFSCKGNPGPGGEMKSFVIKFTDTKEFVDYLKEQKREVNYYSELRCEFIGGTKGNRYKIDGNTYGCCLFEKEKSWETAVYNDAWGKKLIFYNAVCGSEI